AIDDVIGEVIAEFREWLKSEGTNEFFQIGLSMVDYLIKTEQPRAAIELVDRLPDIADRSASTRLNTLRGNAYMRIPSEVRKALPYFEAALADATAVDSPDRHSLIAKAYKELGYYYRNLGKWDDADEAYKSARDAISATLSATSKDADREEMASIQTNWAYVKGLCGSYREGAYLLKSAIDVRGRLGLRQEQGASHSVRGEV